MTGPRPELRRAAAQHSAADGNLEILDASAAHWVLVAFEGECDSSCGGLTCFFDRALASARDSRLIYMEVPGTQLVVEVELDRNPRLCRHSLILQEVLQFLERQTKVSGDLPQLAIREFDTVVVGERRRPISNPKRCVRAALP